MIITTKKHVTRYLGIHPNLDIALTFISSQDLNKLPLGCTNIKTDDVYVNHFIYDTQPKEKGFLEGHENYLDIHIVLYGKELLGYADSSCLSQSQSYDCINDLYIFSKYAQDFVCLDEQYFAITFPEDAHQPKVMMDSPQQVDKVIFKVKIK